RDDSKDLAPLVPPASADRRSWRDGSRAVLPATVEKGRTGEVLARALLPVNVVVPCGVKSEDVSTRVNTEMAGKAIRDGLRLRHSIGRGAAAIQLPRRNERDMIDRCVIYCHSFYSAPEYGRPSRLNSA